MSFEANQPLVSIIVPCYNSQNWVQETVESCLTQTYPNVEIIVVDDGSTDGSREILSQYLPRIRLETGPNRGANSARNRAFALSTGKYIQYLDADDVLEPDKIGRQLRFLKETKADVVYGDWRFRIHLPDSSFSYLDKIRVSGVQQDILASLLSGWWVAPAALLFRRQVVEQVGGWDETLRASQDRDFITSVALSGAKIRYQSGCYSIYRVNHAATLSTSNLSRRVKNHCACLKKSEAALAQTRRLSQEYKIALAIGYFNTARDCYWVDARGSYAIYADTLGDLMNKISDLCLHFTPPDETFVFRSIQRLLGLEFAMHLLFRVRAAINVVKSELKKTFLLNLVLYIRGITLDAPPSSSRNKGLHATRKTPN
jgi:glycosyltransferase involved in cell wall biosynthesis